MDPYKTLNVKRTADKKEIKQAYRDQIKTHHPDRGGSPDNFNQIIIAYNVLSDDRARAEYDRTGKIKDKSSQDTAMENILTLYYSAIQKLDYSGVCFVNLINIMREEGKQILLKQDDAIRNLNVNKEKFIEIKKRFKKKKKGVNVFAAILDNDISKCKDGIAEIKERQRQLKKGLKLLNDYIYKTDLKTTGPTLATELTFDLSDKLNLKNAFTQNPG